MAKLDTPPSRAIPRPGRIEWGLVLAIVLLGLLLRGVFPSRMAVEHFDEGIYASNLWFDAEHRFRYPARHLYAPPLVPWLLEWSQIVFGPTHLGTMFVGIAAGMLSVGLVWWMVRAMFGTPAALAAALLAAMSDYHLIYSRTALTEPVLCLLLLLSVSLLWRAVVEADFRLAVAAGLSTGLCWSAKYNGWLPLAIGIAGLSAWAAFPRSKTPERRSRFLVLLVIAFVALLIVLPVWWDLQNVGGYRAVQENHARYIVGISGWWDSFQRQITNHRFFDGPLSWAGLGLAVVLAGVSSRWGDDNSAEKNSVRRNWLWLAAWAMILAGLGAWLGTSLVLGILGVLWLILACPWRRKTLPAEPPGSDLAYWFIAAWFIGLFLATPLYTPYPRLSLPWLVAGWMTASAMLGSPAVKELLFGRRPWQGGHDGIPVFVSLVGIAFLFGGAAIAFDGSLWPAAWEDRTGLERSAEEIRSLVQEKYRGRAIVYVFAEPAMFYHLRAQGFPNAAPVADLSFTDRPSPVPVLLAFGPHAQRSREFETEFQKRISLFEKLGDFSYTPSELVLLNHYPPETLRDPDFDRQQTIEVYRLKSP